MSTRQPLEHADSELSSAKHQSENHKPVEQQEHPPSSPGNAPASAPPNGSPVESTGERHDAPTITSDNSDEHDEALLDEAIEQSFPASDPIAVQVPHESHEHETLEHSGEHAAPDRPPAKSRLKKKSASSSSHGRNHK